MQQNLSVGISQCLVLTPTLQQALKILQLSNGDLLLEIERALEDNLLLETNQDLGIDLDWESYINRNSEQIDHLSVYPEQKTLGDYLNRQLDLTILSAQDKQVGRAIIDCIDDDGYLRTDIKEIFNSLCKNSSIKLEDILVILHYIQNLEPVGIAARNLKECLLLQLRALPFDTPWLEHSVKLVDNYLDLLAKNDVKKLQQKLQVSSLQLKCIISLVKSLNPKPGSIINISISKHITPDLILEKNNEKWQVKLNQDLSQALKINVKYKSLLNSASSKQEQKFIQNQYFEANSFLKSINDRNTTLLRVANTIFNQQQEFIQNGESMLKPLKLQDVATELGLHRSTISRAVVNKYINTPFGNYELKYFFSTSLESYNSKEFSAKAVCSLLKDKVDNENKVSPYTDIELMQGLANDGIIVARRTVTKYRELLGIPNSTTRKKIT